MTLIPYQHAVTMVRLTSGSINGTALCEITKEVFLFRSGKCCVLLRATPQGRFVSIRAYQRDSNEVNPRPGKPDLEERLNGGCCGEEESKYESASIQDVLQRRRG